MDFGIKELGITLMVGFFAMLGFEAILHYFFNRGIIGFFPGSRSGFDKPDHTMTLTVLILLAFSLGLLVEDVSYKYADSEEVPFRTVLAKILPDEVITGLDLPSEDNDLVMTLVKSLKEPHPIPLARDLGREGGLTIADQSHELYVEEVQEWIKQEKPCSPGEKHTQLCPSRAEVEASLKNLYYYAKNNVYKDENHYDEMKRIQARLEFSRSISLISFFYFIVSLVIGLFLILFYSLKGRKQRKRLLELRVRVPAVLGILFCVYFFSVWAFARETDAFNRRALGYFSTILLYDQRQRELRLKEKGLEGARW